MTVFKNTIFWCEDTRITTIIFCCSSFADSRSLFLLPVRSWCLKTPLLLCEISPVASWFPFLVLFTRYKTFGFCSELLTYSKHVYLFFFFKCLQPYEVGSLNLSTHLLLMRTWATERLNSGLEVVAFPQQPTLLPLPEWNHMGPQVLLEQTRGRPCSAAWLCAPWCGQRTAGKVLGQRRLVYKLLCLLN